MDYEDMSPQELRIEANRRELIKKHKDVWERRAARDVIASIIASIPKEVVFEANARSILKDVLTQLIEANDKESLVTNGDVQMVSHGMPLNWWMDAIRDHPKRDPNSTLDLLEARRLRLWE